MPLAVCATPLGNLDDVTLRVLDELRRATSSCARTPGGRILLDRHGIDSKLVSFHPHNEAARMVRALSRLERGERVGSVLDAGCRQ